MLMEQGFSPTKAPKVDLTLLADLSFFMNFCNCFNGAISVNLVLSYSLDFVCLLFAVDHNSIARKCCNTV